MNRPPLSQRLLAEALGTALLVATVVGSGIMAERLAGGKQALALLGNTIATGAILVGAPRLPDWALPAVIVPLTAAGVLLYLEQRWSEDVNLAFFKVNVIVGFAVLATVIVARLAGGF